MNYYINSYVVSFLYYWLSCMQTSMQNSSGYKAIEIVLEHSPYICCHGAFFCAKAARGSQSVVNSHNFFLG